ncbi:MAG: hypothetical protein DIZ80_15140 [endosymbiont of Galathealinum brachiosum]|uniref:diguanylate cyclase n=1 Tax=endosymbiont of Galathealinum brachiosum TaxID=2200906 RepID=A0A370DA13_9GAMM|nr:MAG: hypothetical protein DIZ80_15140 [endosymbiont of Galathealinum brachiosum]
MSLNKLTHKSPEIESKLGLEQLLQSIDHERRLRILNLFTKLGMVFLLIFGTYSGYQGYLHITAVCYSVFALLVISQLYAVRKKHEGISKGLLILSIAIMYFFLIIDGGVNGTGPLWGYIYIVLIVFIYGSPACNWLAFLFISLAAIYLFAIDPYWNNMYSDDFRVRYIASQIGIFLTARIGENALFLSQGKINQLSQDFYHAAMHDPLTNLLNRRAISDLMVYEQARTQRNEKPLSVLLIDIDHFKYINDKNGHDCGDEVIKIISNDIQAGLRVQDQISRWGGEEFLVLLPETDGKYASMVAEKICSQIACNILRCNGNEITVTVSIGVATYHKDNNLDRIIKLADERLYEAKNNGRNCVV